MYEASRETREKKRAEGKKENREVNYQPINHSAGPVDLKRAEVPSPTSSSHSKLIEVTNPFFEVMLAFPIEKMVIRKYNISEDDFKIMETVVLKTEPHKAGQQWKFAGAFYYATTVLTTIGYGHSTPTTIYGKLFTMCYAIIGIPLGLVMFQSIGERVNKFSSVVIRSVKTLLNCRNVQASEINLICVVTTLSCLTIAGGAAAFSRYEGWSYFDSIYYCFITLTTIGFGDMVALQKDNALNKKPEYVMFALIFILFGLAIVAASLNLLVLRFVTMNTEDERRDEAEALQAAQGAVRLEGDVITANGSILSGQIGNHGNTMSLDDEASVCSCRCSGFQRKRRRPRFTVRRSPGKISHLLPMQQLSALSVRGDPRTSQHSSMLPLPPLYQHRASI
ncbi:PREDICTED: two pore potassium channel protein sup-9 [Atta cephalotes]|uniref:Potassium channel domain-containing protein n=1 Tax=Atta cephalotes TaxID=12957 RepID=A0A158NRK3_ATTCE|nr:PREDICTED: two pore potassium channel protein sup-9 [Atta cephalotes]